MVDADEPTPPRRRRRSARAPQRASQASGVLAEIGAAIQYERAELSRIHAMLKCLYGVLLYADDDDSVMHADVSNVAARLLNESVSRLDAVCARLLQADAKAAESRAADTDAQPHQVKDSPPPHLCWRVVVNSTTPARCDMAAGRAAGTFGIDPRLQ